MQRTTRRRFGVPAVTLLSCGFFAGSVALASPTVAAPVAPCTATITPGGTVLVGTDQLVEVTGLTPSGSYSIVQTHNGAATGPSFGTASASGGFSVTQAYALGTWTDAWNDTSTGATCSVSWTVVAATTTTGGPTTTAAGPTTTAVGPTTTTVASATTSAPAAPAATAVRAAPTFTG